MEVTVYEEKKLKYNKTELSEFSEDRKSYYEDEIKGSGAKMFFV